MLVFTFVCTVSSLRRPLFASVSDDDTVPAGALTSDLEQVELAMDEMEAIWRLVNPVNAGNTYFSGMTARGVLNDTEVAKYRAAYLATEDCAEDCAEWSFMTDCISDFDDDTAVLQKAARPLVGLLDKYLNDDADFPAPGSLWATNKDSEPLIVYLRKKQDEVGAKQDDTDQIVFSNR